MGTWPAPFPNCPPLSPCCRPCVGDPRPGWCPAPSLGTFLAVLHTPHGHAPPLPSAGSPGPRVPLTWASLLHGPGAAGGERCAGKAQPRHALGNPGLSSQAVPQQPRGCNLGLSAMNCRSWSWRGNSPSRQQYGATILSYGPAAGQTQARSAGRKELCDQPNAGMDPEDFIFFPPHAWTLKSRCLKPPGGTHMGLASAEVPGRLLGNFAPFSMNSSPAMGSGFSLLCSGRVRGADPAAKQSTTASKRGGFAMQMLPGHVARASQPLRRRATRAILQRHLLGSNELPGCRPPLTARTPVHRVTRFHSCGHRSLGRSPELRTTQAVLVQTGSPVFHRRHEFPTVLRMPCTLEAVGDGVEGTPPKQTNLPPWRSRCSELGQRGQPGPSVLQLSGPSGTASPGRGKGLRSGGITEGPAKRRARVGRFEPRLPVLAPPSQGLAPRHKARPGTRQPGSRVFPKTSSFSVTIEAP